MAKKLNILWNFLRKLYIININYKPISTKSPLRSSLKAHYEARKITIGFSVFGPQKPDPNRTETGRFGPVPIRFGSFFFPFRFGCFLKVKTEPNRK